MAGVPVIGCDFPEVFRVLNEEPVGALFDVDSPKSIASAIDGLMGDSSRLEIARQATEKIRRTYHWGVAQEELERLYAGLWEVDDGD